MASKEYVKKQITRVKIFQGNKEDVEHLFNSFMLKHHYIEIVKIDTDTDNSFISKITLYYKVAIEI